MEMTLRGKITLLGAILAPLLWYVTVGIKMRGEIHGLLGLFVVVGTVLGYVIGGGIKEKEKEAEKDE